MEWTTSQIDIIKEYFGKKTLKQINEVLGSPCSYEILKKKCQSLGLTRDVSLVRLPHKCSYNYSYWNLPTVENCWVAGWIASDGCISWSKSGTYMLKVKVCIKDEELLDFIRNKLQTQAKKTYYSYTQNGKTYSSVEFRLSSFEEGAKQLKTLFNLDILKTRRLLNPNLSEKQHNWAFIGGMIDGDGSILARKDGTIVFTITSSSKPLIEWIKSMCDQEFPASQYSLKGNGSNIQASKNIKYFTYAVVGLRAAAIINYLKSFPTYKLVRKWDNTLVNERINLLKKEHKTLFKEYNR